MHLDIIPWLEMDFAMMIPILLNVIMMVEIAVDLMSIHNTAQNANALKEEVGVI